MRLKARTADQNVRTKWDITLVPPELTAMPSRANWPITAITSLVVVIAGLIAAAGLVVANQAAVRGEAIVDLAAAEADDLLSVSFAVHIGDGEFECAPVVETPATERGPLLAQLSHGS